MGHGQDILDVFLPHELNQQHQADPLSCVGSPTQSFNAAGSSKNTSYLRTVFVHLVCLNIDYYHVGPASLWGQSAEALISLFSDLSIQRHPLCSCEGPVVFVNES